MNQNIEKSAIARLKSRIVIEYNKLSFSDLGVTYSFDKKELQCQWNVAKLINTIELSEFDDSIPLISKLFIECIYRELDKLDRNLEYTFPISDIVTGQLHGDFVHLIKVNDSLPNLYIVEHAVPGGIKLSVNVWVDILNYYGTVSQIKS